jgi:hypothetical protein
VVMVPIQYEIAGATYKTTYPSYYDINPTLYNRLLANDCARHYWKNYNVIVDDFPLTLVLLEGDGETVRAKFTVDMTDVIFHIKPLEQ